MGGCPGPGGAVFLFKINVCVGGRGVFFLSCLAIQSEIPSENASDVFASHENSDREF